LQEEASKKILGTLTIYSDLERIKIMNDITKQVIKEIENAIVRKG
jgi:hypothetical protein